MLMRYLPLLALALPLLAGCKVHNPGSFETKLMTGVKRNVTVGGKRDRNPAPPTSENIHDGEQQFQNYCTSCHGADGRNTGVLFADKMLPPVPRLDSPAVQAYTDGQLHSIIQHGVSPSGMPAWQDTLSDDEIWHIVLFVRSLKNAPLRTDVGLQPWPAYHSPVAQL
jgi:mono/diheme cytochrome c family protein